MTANSDTAVGGGWDQNVIGGANGNYGGIPSGFVTRRVSVGVAAGPPVANNDILSYGVGSGWNELMIGLNSQSGSFTGGTVYIDNLTLSAIPEPTTAGLAGLFALGCVLQRRRK